MRRKPRCTKIKYKSKAGARRSLRHSKLSHKMRAYRCDRGGLYHLTKEGRQFDERQTTMDLIHDRDGAACVRGECGAGCACG